MGAEDGFGTVLPCLLDISEGCALLVIFVVIVDLAVCGRLLDEAVVGLLTGLAVEPLGETPWLFLRGIDEDLTDGFAVTVLDDLK